MKINILFLALAILVGTNSCTKDSGNNDGGTNQVAALTISDVAYGTDAKQKFDVYLPPNRTNSTTKLIILIHGGGWSQGDKSDFFPFVDTIKARMPAYAIINLNYRLSDGTSAAYPFPTQENDVRAAMNFINSKKEEYKISDKFVVLGASAGGHLALLQSYKNANLKIKAVVNFFGPSDMVDMYNNPASIYAPPSSIAALLSGTPTSNPTLYFSSSPINFVNAQSAATITFQGGLDPLVRASQQQSLHSKLNTNSVPNQLVLYPAEGHGWTGPNLSDSFNKMVAFLNANVQ